MGSKVKGSQIASEMLAKRPKMANDKLSDFLAAMPKN